MEDSAFTAALVGVVLALVKIVEKGLQRANGGSSIEYRLAALESQIESMQNKLQDFQRAFYEFREESRIRWAKQGEKDE
jgi:chaperonin cofactor prefoldin